MVTVTDHISLDVIAVRDRGAGYSTVPYTPRLSGDDVFLPPRGSLADQ